ncbi:MAG: hypothetical protein AAB318_05690, partial [Planctomycetota bacterium]
YKEIEMLYEIISPDAFLRPFIGDFTTLSSVYAVVRNAYTRTVYVDKAFQKKTNELVQKHVGALMIAETPAEFVKIDKATLDTIRQRKKEQAAKGLDGLTYFVLCKLTDNGIPNPEAVSRKVAEAFAVFPNWRRSDAELREVRKQVTFALVAEEEDIEKVASAVEALFTLLQKSFRP